MLGKFKICKQCECVDAFMNGTGKCTKCRTGLWHNKFPYQHITAFSPAMRVDIVNGLELTQSLLFNSNWATFLAGYTSSMLSQAAPNNNNQTPA
jgi:hypothetical protein